MLSIFHNNRRAYNWLLYKINDEFLYKYRHLYRGNLYDLGCGEKPYKNIFLQYCDTYTGIDWGSSPHTLTADIVTNLNEVLPIEDGVADTAVSLSVMEHLSEPQLMLAESFRILRSDGYVVFQVPFMWHVHEAPYDFFRYTRYGLEYMFKNTGFVDIKIEATTGFWVMWFLKFNYQTVRIVKGPRFLRVVTRLMLLPLWWLDQHLARFLDHVWPESDGETAGYFVTARKP